MHDTGRRHIGVIGGGIAGLGAAWLLARRHRVTLLERNDYIGGHTHTVRVDDPSGPVWVDTGFMVFNRRNYPQLCALFEHLGLDSYPTVMSFSASLEDGGLEYAGSNPGTLFAQRRNLLRPRFLRMLGEILRFNRQAKALIAEQAPEGPSVGQFLARGGFSDTFARAYLLPMTAAIWSAPTARMLEFPFSTLARFMDNHGLLDLRDRPRWRTLTGGSHRYVQRMLADFGGEHRTHCPVRRLWREADGVTAQTASGERLRFDEVVLACHADEARDLIGDKDAAEDRLLGSFRYQPNRVYLHDDPALMPRRRAVWSSWNYLQRPDEAGASCVSVSYWMNRLQDLGGARDLFVTLNPARPPRQGSVAGRYLYHHPLFDAAAIQAQQRMDHIQGRRRLWFAGSYLGYGFHEDAFRSALAVARALGVSAPWERDPAPSSGQALPLPGVVAET